MCVGALNPNHRTNEEKKYPSSVSGARGEQFQEASKRLLDTEVGWNEGEQQEEDKEEWDEKRVAQPSPLTLLTFFFFSSSLPAHRSSHFHAELLLDS